MKKFLKVLSFILVPLFVLALATSALAIIIVPSGNIVIIKNTIGADDMFKFSDIMSGGAFGLPNSFDIATSGKTGSRAFNGLQAFQPNSYTFTENVIQPWKLENIQCSSTGFGSRVYVDNNSVSISLAAWETVTCVFTNTQNVSKTPVLIVPGIMGTQIFKQTELLWPDVIRMLNPFHNDAFMKPLSFKMDGTPLDTSLSLGQIIDKAGTLNYTQKLINDFKSQGYTSGKDLFLFPYDWRRDIRDTAITDDPLLQNASLKQTVNQILLSSGVNKIDIIAHSQGGLVVKELLQEMREYQSKINKLVFVGVPNLGTPKAAKVLLYGDSMDVSFAGMGLNPAVAKEISQNMPAVYELLPSQEYFNHVNGYLGKPQILSRDQPILHVSTLNSVDTTQFLKDQNLNGSLIDRANIFHSSSYDNLDFSNSGVETYNIVGCQTGTLGKILVKADGDFKIMPIAGDGTVPFFSANNIPGATTYFALESDHGRMLTEDGSRQQIVNIIAGSTFSTGGKITQNISDCHFNGTEVSSHSPVNLHIYDSLGRHVGPASDGGFDYEIPNVGYDVIERGSLSRDSFVFLPAGGQYTVKLTATSGGSFSFDSSIIQEGQVTGSAYYDHIAITASSTAEIILNSNNDQNIQLDIDGNGTIDQTVQPSAILDANQSRDLVAPTTTISLLGDAGQPGFYRGNVTVTLTATDPILPGQESSASGILKILYKLDSDADFREYAVSPNLPSGPLFLTEEGKHTITYYSIDRAGNREMEKNLLFVIDRTPPEIGAQFDLGTNKFIFQAIDNLDPHPSLLCSVAVCQAQDEAGNDTILDFTFKDEKHEHALRLKQISYNSQKPAIFPKNVFEVDLEEEDNTFKEFEQVIGIKKVERARIEYQAKKDRSIIIIKTKGETRNKQIVKGKKFLDLITKKGVLEIIIK